LTRKCSLKGDTFEGERGEKIREKTANGLKKARCIRETLRETTLGGFHHGIEKGC